MVKSLVCTQSRTHAPACHARAHLIKRISGGADIVGPRPTGRLLGRRGRATAANAAIARPERLGLWPRQSLASSYRASSFRRPLRPQWRQLREIVTSERGAIHPQQAATGGELWPPEGAIAQGSLTRAPRALTTLRAPGVAYTSCAGHAHPRWV